MVLCQKLTSCRKTRRQLGVGAFPARKKPGNLKATQNIPRGTSLLKKSRQQLSGVASAALFHCNVQPTLNPSICESNPTPPPKPQPQMQRYDRGSIYPPKGEKNMCRALHAGLDILSHGPRVRDRNIELALQKCTIDGSPCPTHRPISFRSRRSLSIGTFKSMVSDAWMAEGNIAGNLSGAVTNRASHFDACVRARFLSRPCCDLPQIFRNLRLSEHQL